MELGVVYLIVLFVGLLFLHIGCRKIVLSGKENEYLKDEVWSNIVAGKPQGSIPFCIGEEDYISYKKELKSNGVKYVAISSFAIVITTLFLLFQKILI